ncbi:cytochrome c-type biogenesis protein [Microvirga brassicacearum]|uniref:Cytochrome c-type biogenesis protein n=1 Tax=Microvirga brassicacearum TaxID=2580413 RepID=A0A5N3P7M3_9HYPH|nr:cytochrome c-type biogenesis protein [Microvirga brassicacearum]KAB0265651.1 cytochrome c-type biogenesis protein CcmH [Microvirga brassicacearum]
MTTMRVVLAIVAILFSLGSAHAVQPNEVLKDPVLERRARDISAGLRCLVCQNQSIDDSDADLARDLRLLVRERLTAGDTDAQVRDFVVQRYGEFVLLRPTFRGRTLVLWLTPVLVLVVGGLGIYTTIRRRPAAASLNAEETRAVEALLKRDEDTA